MQVANKRYSKAFRQMAVERMKRCDNISELSEELGVHRRYLYTWCNKLDPAGCEEGPPPESTRETTLRKEVSKLKRVLADKTVEADFFKGALQKVEARRQRIGDTGEKASTTKSGK
ncbi:MAG: hypothetical protein A2W38_05960 [Deltaproteobacteria bacterium RBG_19FT_COMBO_58_16]|nr:MAG: hypothetical protein A2W38_05960 [Deltaproteobacteria bacterium RBG_19FT_COMBO_58_16]